MYLKPKTLEEVLSLLSQYGSNHKILAGGTDLAVLYKDKKLCNYEGFIDISNLKELQKIKLEENHLIIGTLSTFSQIINSQLIKEKAPLLVESALKVGSLQIRNRATIGGNLGNASPAGDSIPPLIVLDAEVELASKDGRRKVKVEELFLDPGKTIIRKDELITYIFLPLPEKKRIGFYKKIGQRKAMAIAKVSVAFSALQDLPQKELRNVRIALGAVAPRVIRALKAESLLEKQVLSQQLIEEVSQIASLEALPICDIRSTDKYRRQMVKVLLSDGLTEILAK